MTPQRTRDRRVNPLQDEGIWDALVRASISRPVTCFG